MKIGIGVAIISLLVGGGAVASGTDSPRVAFACGFCENCLGGHTNKYSLSFPESEGIHDGCIAVAGCPHPDCIVTFNVLPEAEAVRGLLTLAEDGSLEAPVELLRTFGGSVVYNAERHALQVPTPCSGDGYISHIPLNDDQVRAIEVALST